MSRLFITRPIATSLLAIALCLGGLLGYRALPVAALPQVDFPDFSRIGCPSLPKYNFLELGKTLVQASESSDSTAWPPFERNGSDRLPS
jgi:hypothetical protein